MIYGQAALTAIGLVVAVAGCVQVPGYAYLPVTIQLLSGERLDGGAAIRLLSGKFRVTDGHKACDGSFRLPGLGKAASLFAKRSDGARVTSSDLDLGTFSRTGTLSFDGGGFATVRYGDAVR